MDDAEKQSSQPLLDEDHEDPEKLSQSLEYSNSNQSGFPINIRRRSNGTRTTHPEDERGKFARIKWLVSILAPATICIVLLLCILVQSIKSPEQAPKGCANGRTTMVRREWRRLAAYERQNYISAVQCLQSLPSREHLGHPEVTRWYDFAWTHYQIGYIAHDAACFLSWHRWFIALFEDSLRKECKYSGALPYWDWTLDWKHPERAPVFDSKSGFGGNGDVSNDERCVTEGPFAGARIPFDYDAVAGEGRLLNAQGQNTSFCLARNFSRGSSFNASHLDPRYINKMLEKSGYIHFLAALEFGPHNDIPFGINGTFLTLYAPADPIFWLHHAQLDRLWWMWQSAKSTNARAYDGPSTSKSRKSAKLDDQLPFGKLSEDVAVKDIIDTEGGRLCYRYS